MPYRNAWTGQYMQPPVSGACLYAERCWGHLRELLSTSGLVDAPVPEKLITEAGQKVPTPDEGGGGEGGQMSAVQPLG